jgi:hypothetical protein
MQGDKGPFIMLAKWFNPAGVQDDRGGESILISVFEPKAKDDAPRQQAKPQRQAPAPSGFEDMPDCPF